MHVTEHSYVVIFTFSLLVQRKTAGFKTHKGLFRVPRSEKAMKCQ